MITDGRGQEKGERKETLLLPKKAAILQLIRVAPFLLLLLLLLPKPHPTRPFAQKNRICFAALRSQDYMPRPRCVCVHPHMQAGLGMKRPDKKVLLGLLLAACSGSHGLFAMRDRPGGSAYSLPSPPAFSGFSPPPLFAWSTHRDWPMFTQGPLEVQKKEAGPKKDQAKSSLFIADCLVVWTLVGRVINVCTVHGAHLFMDCW